MDQKKNSVPKKFSLPTPWKKIVYESPVQLVDRFNALGVVWCQYEHWSQKMNHTHSMLYFYPARAQQIALIVIQFYFLWDSHGSKKEEKIYSGWLVRNSIMKHIPGHYCYFCKHFCWERLHAHQYLLADTKSLHSCERSHSWMDFLSVSFVGGTIYRAP